MIRYRCNHCPWRPPTVQTGWGIDRKCPICGTLYKEEKEPKDKELSDEELRDIQDSMGWW